MVLRRRHVALAALPVTAVLAFACGPTATSAYAQCRARIEREQKSKRHAPAGDPRGNHGGLPPASSDQRKPLDKRTCETAFVAPEAAKPAGAEMWRLGPMAAARPEHALAPLRCPGEVPLEPLTFVSTSSRLTYHANAPPVS